jgi:hypothetical protein
LHSSQNYFIAGEHYERAKPPLKTKEEVESLPSAKVIKQFE